MASIIIFGTLVGICLAEWKGASRRTHRLMLWGLAVLISSTVIIGYGNYLAKQTTPSAGLPNPVEKQAASAAAESSPNESFRSSKTPRGARAPEAFYRKRTALEPFETSNLP